MSLNLDRLESVRVSGNKTTARCPACAESGKDTGKDHLLINPDGSFGCVNFPGPEGSEHRKRIFALAGSVEKTPHRAPPARQRKPERIFPSAEEAAKICTPAGASLESVFMYPRDGKPFAAVARYRLPDDKTFRQFHCTGTGWAAGGPSGKWPLYRLTALPESGPLHVFEGEKKTAVAAAMKLAATTSAGGSKAASKTDWTPLRGRDVRIWPDADEAGERYAATVADILTKLTPPARLKIVRLPYEAGTGKDIADFLAEGHGASELRKLVEAAPLWEPPSAPEPAQPETEPVGKPVVILPHGAQSISETGRTLGELLAATERYFIRGGAVVKLAEDPDGLPHLAEVKPAALASDFEAVADLCKNTGDEPEPATCPEQTAKLIAASAAFREAMPPIRVLTRCPVLVERAGSLVQISGYDRQSGIFAAGKPAEPMDVAEARRLLSEMLDGFRFNTPADRARALAAIVTPALVFGGLLKGRAPIDLGEADASQAGKGYRNKLTAALYAQSVRTVTQQKNGVGSLEESFNAALIRGANFIALDNVRGRIDSPAFESFLTEDTYSARMPYREPVELDPRRVVVMLTSNKADVTPDLSARCACVLIQKQADGHAFKPYPEGDILEHVRAEQPRYLGAVFAVVLAWYAAGKPKTTETRHDFRPWAQVLDWITRNLLDAGPLLDGHRETQARMTNPVLNWLRDVALEVSRAKQAGAWLRASDLVDLIAETAIETPGLPEHGNLTDPETRENAQRATGRKLGLCFRAGDVVTLDGMMIERREGYETASRYTVREYRFTAAAIAGPDMPAQAESVPEQPPEPDAEEAEIDPCGHSCGHAAAIAAAMKPLCAAIAAIDPLHGKHSDTPKGSEGVDIGSMGTYGRMTATPAIEEGEFA